MILCGGDQVLFGLYSAAIICLLIGGCLWGQGKDNNENTKKTWGIVIFSIGGGLFILAIFTNVVKNVRSLHKKRQKAKVTSENAKPFVKVNEQFKITGVQKMDNFVQPHGNNLQVNNSNNISADQFKVVTNPFPHQPPIDFTNNRPVLDKISGNNNHNISPQVYYTNPVFEPEKVYSQPFSSFTQIQKPNAAKNYSRSLYNAHLAGKL